MKALIGLLLLFQVSVSALAQAPLSDLYSEIVAGRIELRSLAGNGSSSGAAIEGEAVNLSTTSVSIDVHLEQPLFLLNRGKAQNMVVSAIFPASGSYRKDRRGSYFQLGPKAVTRVILIAYCADFEKDNPGPQDRFQVVALPDRIKPVMTKIQRYMRANPDQDITVAAQAALWMAQGVSLERIREKFTVSTADASLARSLLQ